MKIELNLIIAHMDLDTLDHAFLLDENESIITVDIDTEDTILSQLRKLTLDYIEIDPSWLDYKLVDVHKNTSDTLNVIYFVFIPKMINNKIGKWFNIGNIKDNYVKKTLFMATQTIRF